MPRKSLDYASLFYTDSIACRIATTYDRWRQARMQWEADKVELRQFVYATDTTKTANGSLPWHNTTTRPKLCQIRDNLHANYISALSLNGNFLKWEGKNQDDSTENKALIASAYVRTKMDESGAYETISQLIYDYIDFGIAIGGVEYVNYTNTGEDGNPVEVYKGPRLVRYNPLDVVFDITGDSFDSVPKITRSLLGLGDLSRLAVEQPELKYDTAAIQKLLDNRNCFANEIPAKDWTKIEGFRVDGFGSLQDYYTSGMVEILTFEGDYYDIDSGTLYTNAVIVVADRSIILANRVNPSWLGKSNKRACVWRPRPDNLMGMGPLDNLVGLQYRIDHLENMKADVWDQIAYPMLKVKGYVQDFEYVPGAKIYTDQDGDVNYLSPDTTALNADLQIQNLEQEMEEMAGAPKQAMGIRTPGEKTAYEVQSLDSAAGRIFQVKVTQFERGLFEPLLNLMLESGRRMLDDKTVVRNVSDDLGVAIYTAITKEDLQPSGRLKAVGARHFSERARIVQELTAFFASGVGRDPGVRVHFSGKNIAKLFSHLLDTEYFRLYRENVQVDESLDTQMLQQTAQDHAAQVSTTDSGLAGEALDLTQQLADQTIENQGVSGNDAGQTPA